LLIPAASPLVANAALIVLSPRYSTSGAAPEAQSGLNFLANGAAGSDIRLAWSGANLLSRTAQTVIWKAFYAQQSGYYADVWDAENDGSFHFSKYEHGTHPYPCDGAFNGTGQATGGTGESGDIHYFEIAGLGDGPEVLFGHDFIASPGGTAKLVVNGIWYTHARTVEVVSGTILRHTFWPDVVNDPSYVIQQDLTLADLNVPTSPAFIVGCSPWTSSNFAGTGSGYTNTETPGNITRGIKLFNAPLTISDIASEAASATNSPVTAAGIASVWYMNENPTPTDITDKSGAGHTPTWANANRPTLWTP